MASARFVFVLVDANAGTGTGTALNIATLGSVELALQVFETLAKGAGQNVPTEFLLKHFQSRPNLVLLVIAGRGNYRTS